MQFTKEQLIARVRENIRALECFPAQNIPQMDLALAQIALVVLTAEPVAWRLVDSPESSVTVTDNEKMAAIWKRNGRNVQPLYSTAHGSADAVGMVVSEGRQPSAHNPESRIFEVLVESGYEPVPGDKLYAAPPAPVVPEECPAELPYAQVKAVADLFALCWQSGEVVTYTPDPEKATIWLNNYSGTCVQEYVKLERLQEALAGNSPVIPDFSFSGLVNSARALLDVLCEFGADEVAISEYVTNLEDALRVAAAQKPETMNG